jgi:hypothetical protein
MGDTRRLQFQDRAGAAENHVDGIPARMTTSREFPCLCGPPTPAPSSTGWRGPPDLTPHAVGHRVGGVHMPTSARRRSPDARPAPPGSTHSPEDQKPAFPPGQLWLPHDARRALPARPHTRPARCPGSLPPPAATRCGSRPPAAPPPRPSPAAQPAPSLRGASSRGPPARASASASTSPPPHRYTHPAPASPLRPNATDRVERLAHLAPLPASRRPRPVEPAGRPVFVLHGADSAKAFAATISPRLSRELAVCSSALESRRKRQNTIPFL